MRILLAGINAKYIQTNLAIRLLKAYADTWSSSVRKKKTEIIFKEWNINQLPEITVKDIYSVCPDIVIFSTYIWNRQFILRVVSDIRKILPSALIGLGGPEVSWAAEKTFSDSPETDFILSGEGEQTFTEFADMAADAIPQTDKRTVLEKLGNIPGVYTRISGGTENSAICFGGTRPPIENLDRIPFVYTSERMDFDPAHRIVYYESSRGCPYSCAYCLSARDTGVRYYPFERVLSEISYFMDSGFPLVKFVDRTFNLKPDRFLKIWSYIAENHNGKTVFHFEIAAESLSEEAFAVLEKVPHGAIQFEIGIQSINEKTLKIVGRPAHPAILAEKIRRIPKTIHTHIDLIAGLPAENLESFAASFNYAFSLGADILQLGFLKILSGSPMEDIVRSDSGFLWSETPPYEILATPDLPYSHLILLKETEYILESWYNSGLMRKTISFLVFDNMRNDAFSFFRDMVSFNVRFYPDGDIFLPRKPADSFACMAAYIKDKKEHFPDFPAELALEYLKYDFLLQGKPGFFPEWYVRRYSKEAHDRALMEQDLFSGTGSGRRASRRTLYACTEYEQFHFSGGDAPKAILFVYTKNGGKKVRCVEAEVFIDR
ncbi:B12-binding domain-containing radical SAM protein [Brucepastera parasyntrophica]|uniref:B12-binding domain-containing radical SAM protein n=1 Tax=Brucepastera parasyntrophica TaxID=2880008 RepID=UPI00210D1A3C|nr:B12-binding domain-containing radical SAM protein [Brucepastera parasyntrophica]ULQ58802.1 B12-binding domain-containing radical SAM protein [Brucepastera parasyntrophica]